ncbi:hypothetical protein THIOM_004938 [Candidatus Thiomargarita nelsonii]|uniref:Uncharacterized protein n=1 Tax=Candidatus Thiomargarita nelsonii TaxID=1003181 RepID=A0A176RUJ4_9GAMM|nr:hypothetical protein THIOM_004938 [Candidatus Thiomargarita nelsonii]
MGEFIYTKIPIMMAAIINIMMISPVGKLLVSILTSSVKVSTTFNSSSPVGDMTEYCSLNSLCSSPNGISSHLKPNSSTSADISMACHWLFSRRSNFIRLTSNR